MNQYQSISQLKDHAKDMLLGKYGSAATQTLIHSAITATASSAVSAFFSFVVMIMLYSVSGGLGTYRLSFGASAAVYIIQYILNMLVAILTRVFSTGIALFFLNIASGRTAAVSNLFYGFQHLFKKSLTISAVTTLLYYVCLLPFDVFYFLYNMDSSINWLVGMVISLVVGMIFYIPISLSFSQVYYILLDFPSNSAKEILRLSVRLMKGRKRKLFAIQFSFLPLLILGVLSFGLGFLWVTPYMNMTMALYFLDIMKPKATNTTVE